MIVLVTGDRKWKNEAKIAKALYKRRKKIKLVIQGGAAGADTIAKIRADLLGLLCITADANWAFFGRSAGPIRNNLMLKIAMAFAEYTDDELLVLAFHSNLKESKGTMNMITQAKKHRIKVKVIR